MLEFSNTFVAGIASAVILNAGCSAAFAQTAVPRPLGPCKKIAVACENAGFIQGGGPEGRGPWRDCAVPLMRDEARPASAKPLPIIDPQLKAACLAAQPQLGRHSDERPTDSKDLTYMLSLPSSPDPWSQPGTGVSPDLSIGGGTFSPLYQGPGIGIVLYDRAFDVYLGASISFATGHPAIVIRTSTDLIHWSEPIGPPIDDGNRAVSYFTMLGETEDPSIAGSEPKIYFMSTAEGKVGFQNAVFKVVKVKLSRK